MNQYDGNDIAVLADLGPTNRQLLLAKPVASWDTEDWHYAVLAADEFSALRAQIMDLPTSPRPE